jgi:hypothetical protein
MKYIHTRSDGRARCLGLKRRSGNLGIQCSLPRGHYGRHMHQHHGYWTTAQARAALEATR